MTTFEPTPLSELPPVDPVGGWLEFVRLWREAPAVGGLVVTGTLVFVGALLLIACKFAALPRYSPPVVEVDQAKSSVRARWALAMFVLMFGVQAAILCATEAVLIGGSALTPMWVAAGRVLLAAGVLLALGAAGSCLLYVRRATQVAR